MYISGIMLDLEHSILKGKPPEMSEILLLMRLTDLSQASLIGFVLRDKGYINLT